MAQSRVEVTPYFATYFPISHFYEYNQVSTDLGGRTKQTIGPAVGLQLMAGIRPQFNLLADLKVVSTGIISTSDQLDEANSPTPAASAGGNLVVATGGVVYRPRRANLRLAVGAGWMSRSGDAWDEERYGGAVTFKTGNFTTSFSVASRAQLTPTFPIFVGLEALVYSIEKVELPESTDPDFEQAVKKLQVDVLLKLGVPIGGQ